MDEQQDFLRNEPNKELIALPNSTPSLVLGIVSIVGSFCLLGFGGLVCGIIGLNFANKNRDLYNGHPQMYSAASLKTSNAGRICSIIGIIFSSLCILLIAYNLFRGISGYSYHNK